MATTKLVQIQHNHQTNISPSFDATRRGVSRRRRPEISSVLFTAAGMAGSGLSTFVTPESPVSAGVFRRSSAKVFSLTQASTGDWSGLFAALESTSAAAGPVTGASALLTGD